MIFGIGTDIISLARIEKSVERHGDKFAERILSSNELEQFANISTEKSKIAFLAKRFAAKEAVSKALGTGMRNGIDFVQLSVENNDLGKPEVVLSGKALEWAESHSVSNIQLTISDEDSYAVAFCVVEA